METITIKRNIKNLKEKVKYEGQCKLVNFTGYWDGDTYTHVMEKKTFKNCHVKLIERSWEEFDRHWNEMIAFINNVEIEAEITSVKGTTNRLEIKGCMGAG